MSGNNKKGATNAQKPLTANKQELYEEVQVIRKKIQNNERQIESLNRGLEIEAGKCKDQIATRKAEITESNKAIVARINAEKKRITDLITTYNETLDGETGLKSQLEQLKKAKGNKKEKATQISELEEQISVANQIIKYNNDILNEIDKFSDDDYRASFSNLVLGLQLTEVINCYEELSKGKKELESYNNETSKEHKRLKDIASKATKEHAKISALNLQNDLLRLALQGNLASLLKIEAEEIKQRKLETKESTFSKFTGPKSKVKFNYDFDETISDDFDNTNLGVNKDNANFQFWSRDQVPNDYTKEYVSRKIAEIKSHIISAKQAIKDSLRDIANATMEGDIKKGRYKQFAAVQTLIQSNQVLLDDVKEETDLVLYNVTPKAKTTQKQAALVEQNLKATSAVEQKSLSDDESSVASGDSGKSSSLFRRVTAVFKSDRLQETVQPENNIVSNDSPTATGRESKVKSQTVPQDSRSPAQQFMDDNPGGITVNSSEAGGSSVAPNTGRSTTSTSETGGSSVAHNAGRSTTSTSEVGGSSGDRLPIEVEGSTNTSNASTGIGVESPREAASSTNFNNMLIYGGSGVFVAAAVVLAYSNQANISQAFSSICPDNSTNLLCSWFR